MRENSREIWPRWGCTFAFYLWRLIKFHFSHFQSLILPGRTLAGRIAEPKTKAVVHKQNYSLHISLNEVYCRCARKWQACMTKVSIWINYCRSNTHTQLLPSLAQHSLRIVIMKFYNGQWNEHAWYAKHLDAAASRKTQEVAWLCVLRKDKRRSRRQILWSKPTEQFIMWGGGGSCRLA